MNTWLQLSSRLRLGLIVTLLVAAVCSWGFSMVAKPQTAPASALMPATDTLPAAGLLDGLTPMQVQQSLQRTGLTLQQLSFNHDQAQVELQSQWQPFIDLISHWSASSLAPMQYQLQFSDQLSARLQLTPGRFQAPPPLPAQQPTLLALNASVEPQKAPAAAAIACTVEPPRASLAALWPSRGYALVHTDQQVTRVVEGSTLRGSNWSVTAITSQALHLTLTPPPEGCNEPQRYILSGTQKH